MDKVPVSKLADFVPLMQPTRPVLVTTRFKDGKINVAPFSWCTPVSVNPPLVLLALATIPRKQRSLLNILREGQFVVNMPGAELAERLARASYFYPKGMNKQEVLDFKTGPAQVLAVPILTECRAHIECKLVQAIPAGDHTLLMADVVAASYNPDLFDRNLVLKTDKALPLLHLRHYLMPDNSGQTFHFMASPIAQSRFVPFPPGGLDANGQPVADKDDDRC